MKSLIFNFENAAQAQKSLTQAVRLFGRAGATVASSTIAPRTERTSSVSWRAVNFTFIDSQQVSLRVKLTGDVYQVLINGRVLPIKYQDDPAKAIAEIAAALDVGRVAWQRKLARVRSRPAGVRREFVSRVMAEKRIRNRVVEKQQLLAEGQAELTEIRRQIGTFN